MTTRREFISASGAGVCLLAGPLVSLAQPKPGKMPRLGILSSEGAGDVLERGRIEALRDGLKELGYEDGKNIAITSRFAESKYDRLAGLAMELVAMKVDVIIPFGIKATVEARRATATIPIVLPSTQSDLVAMGLAASLARPGGNVTGYTLFGAEITAKRLELMKETLPRISRVGILINPANPSVKSTSQETIIAAKTLKVSVQQFEVRATSQFDAAFSSMVQQRMDAVMTLDDTVFSNHPGVIANLALKKRLPAAGNRLFGEAGGLLGYGVDALATYRDTARFVDKILKGARPGDLPIERAMKFELVINMKTATALGVTIPPSVLVRADRVIE